jgi:hypothetical protein
VVFVKEVPMSSSHEHDNQQGALVQIDPGLLMDLHHSRTGHWPRLLTFVALYPAAALGAYHLAGTFSGQLWASIALAPLILLASISTVSLQANN